MINKMSPTAERQGIAADCRERLLQREADQALSCLASVETKRLLAILQVSLCQGFINEGALDIYGRCFARLPFKFVIPAKAGIQWRSAPQTKPLDSRLRGNDE